METGEIRYFSLSLKTYPSVSIILVKDSLWDNSMLPIKELNRVWWIQTEDIHTFPSSKTNTAR